MLSKNARQTLKLAKSTKEQAVSFFDLQEKFGWDFDAAKSACSQLVENGFASDKYHRPYPGQQLLWGIVLSEKGRNSAKFFWASFCSFLVKSVIVPIAVSFTTAVLTTLAMR